MLARTLSATPWGIEARPVTVEVEAASGLPAFEVSGLSERALRETLGRVRSALRSSGFELPPRIYRVVLQPVDLLKHPPALDLALALALLAAVGELPDEALAGRLFSGELALNGSVRSVRGSLAAADLASRSGIEELLVARENAAEAAALGTVRVLPVRSLREAVDHLRGISPIEPHAPTREVFASRLPVPDLKEVRGQEAAKRALEVAAAGGHHLRFVGPPGSGKTMLARRLPGLLPALDREEAIALTKIYSAVAADPLAGLSRVRPFRSPHPTISSAGMVGGGLLPRPGEVTLAHGGVLFLDELPEFRRDALEALRQPLDEGSITVVRTRGRFDFPARLLLVVAMAPCPCGHRGDPRHACRCPARHVDRYRARISQGLMERIDLHVEVPAVSVRELRGRPPESSAEVAERVGGARAAQRRRLGSRLNSHLSAEELELHCPLQDGAERLWERAFERLKLSLRQLQGIRRVARTIADLEGSETISAAQVGEAIQYRSLG